MYLQKWYVQRSLPWLVRPPPLFFISFPHCFNFYDFKKRKYLKLDKRDDEPVISGSLLPRRSLKRAPEDGKGGCLHTEASSWTIRFMHERANHPREERGGKDPENGVYVTLSIGNWSRMSIWLFEQPEGWEERAT